MIAELFDGIGVLLEQNLIDIKMVDKLFGPTLNLLWDRMKPDRLNSYRESNK